MRRLTPIPVLAVALVGACAAPDDEAALRELVAGAEAAAEARDTGFFRGVISGDYMDRAGRGRDELVGQIRGYFFLNRKVEVVTRIERIEIMGDDAAEMVVQAALIGRGSAAGIGADFRRIDLELVREGSDWRVIAAGWGDDR